MFVLTVDENGYEKLRVQAKRFNKRVSLRVAVEKSLITLMSAAWEDKVSLVLDSEEDNLLEKIFLRLHGGGYRQSQVGALLGYIALDAVQPILFGDSERFRTAAEDISWKDKKGNLFASCGISIYRVKKRERPWSD